jgi:hypothetical protein
VNTNTNITNNNDTTENFEQQQGVVKDYSSSIPATAEKDRANSSSSSTTTMGEERRRLSTSSADTEPRNTRYSTTKAVTPTNSSTSTSTVERPTSKQEDGIGSGTAANRVTCPSVSEVAVAREFFQAGRLHTAITFGVDVRSLLCAIVDEDEIIPLREGNNNDEDLCTEQIMIEKKQVVVEESSSKNLDTSAVPGNNNISVGALEDMFPKANKCPIRLAAATTPLFLDKPPSADIPKGRRPRYSNDVILAHRLFHTELLYEAELDYNRVVASQVCAPAFRRLSDSCLFFVF